MKVILLQDVKSLGKEGEIVNVSDGYARNYVIPKKLGVEANDKNKNDLKLKKQREAKEAAQRLAEAQKLAEDLEKVTVVVTMKAGEGGRVFGSVSAKDMICSPLATGGRYFCFCSSLPASISGPPPREFEVFA